MSKPMNGFLSVWLKALSIVSRTSCGRSIPLRGSKSCSLKPSTLPENCLYLSMDCASLPYWQSWWTYFALKTLKMRTLEYGFEKNTPSQKKTHYSKILPECTDQGCGTPPEIGALSSRLVFRSWASVVPLAAQGRSFFCTSSLGRTALEIDALSSRLVFRPRPSVVSLSEQGRSYSMHLLHFSAGHCRGYGSHCMI